MIVNLNELALGALLNLVVAFIIVRGIYYPETKEKSYVITFLAFNTIIYFMLSMLTSVELTVGVGFGLFAIFSVLRYRTDEMPIREMTYLFVIIALPVINSLLAPDADLPTLAFVNLSVIVLMFVLEKGWGFRFSASQRVLYERID